MKTIIKKLLNLTLIMLVSVIFTYSSIFYDGKAINTSDELKQSFPMVIGFPIGFVELTWVKIDPPLPHFYGINCCGTVWHQEKFLLSVLIVFIFLSLLCLITRRVTSIVKNRS